MNRQTIYLIKTGILKPSVPILEVKSNNEQKQKRKVKRINRNTKKWREFKKRFVWVEDLLSRNEEGGGN